MSDQAQSHAQADDPCVLRVKDLKTDIKTPEGVARVVDGASFSLAPGETLAIVGESGSGKTMLARSIMGLIPEPPGIRAGGEIILQGNNIRSFSEKQLAGLRGKVMGMIFQDPMTSLNPVLTIGEQIGEVLRKHLRLTKPQARQRAQQLLAEVGVPMAQQRLDEYPHQLSGGLRQRVMIAMTVSCHPALLIADEPTTALDVSVQAQILRLLKRYQRQHNMAMIFVSHDLGTVAGMADRIAVMYAGKIVEQGPAWQVIHSPRMRYTQALLNSIPQMSAPSHRRLNTIEGRPPNLTQLPAGCAFAARCAFAQDKCRQSEPPMVHDGNPSHEFACWFPQSPREVSHEQ